jgi:hypothetical protein
MESWDLMKDISVQKTDSLDTEHTIDEERAVRYDDMLKLWHEMESWDLMKKAV